MIYSGEAAKGDLYMEEVIKLIKDAKSVAILGHISEDADSVGSSLAMKRALEKLGKRAVIYYSARLEHRLSFMKADGVYFDGTAEKFDLCLCLDCGDYGRLGKRAAVFEAAKHTASIDHHVTNTKFAEANYVVADASATGEILYEVIGALGTEMDKEIAENLFIAIASDTGSFKYSNVSPQTMRITAALLEQGIDNAYLSRMLFDTETEKAMHFKGYIMSRIRTCFDGRLAIVAVKKAEFEQFGIDERDTGDIVNIARMTEGAEIAVSVRETEERIKISFRSNGRYDVGALALKLGGGGHAMASGASVACGRVEEVCEKVMELCGDLFND